MSIMKRAAVLTAASLLLGGGSLAAASGASASTYACHYSFNDSNDYAYAGHYSGTTYIPSDGEFSSPVIEAQCLLNIDGLDPGLTVDGIYGPNTQAAVRNLQSTLHLHADGYVGPQTWPYLRNAAYKNG